MWKRWIEIKKKDGSEVERKEKKRKIDESEVEIDK